MALKNTTEKLDEYQERLKHKKAKPISRKHVEKVIDKLASKHDDLKAELKAASKPSKRDRIRAKVKVVEELQSRANWLLEKVKKSK
ncbi:hypothetical protein [Aliiruegeria sabulilitoris]|uniref:hypothetical protein n=1 Tax=Aliiruegeria sabulilitoris TaxID=1510458 RepID=UPI00082FD40A|nr:hypothetical protein [Aliiruegeria sabulilitoris]NDR57937.1 hypothetical protein [Pseudoruegeria sp. M32A2M]